MRYFVPYHYDDIVLSGMWRVAMLCCVVVAAYALYRRMPQKRAVRSLVIVCLVWFCTCAGYHFMMGLRSATITTHDCRTWDIVRFSWAAEETYRAKNGRLPPANDWNRALAPYVDAEFQPRLASFAQDGYFTLPGRRLVFNEAVANVSTLPLHSDEPLVVLYEAEAHTMKSGPEAIREDFQDLPDFPVYVMTLGGPMRMYTADEANQLVWHR